MDVHVCAGFDIQGAVGIDQSIAVNYVRQFVGPMDVFQTISHNLEFGEAIDLLIGHDVASVLPPSHQFDELGVAVGDKQNAVFHYKRCTLVVGVNGHVEEREQAVFGRDKLIVKLRAALTIDIDLKA